LPTPRCRVNERGYSRVDATDIGICAEACESFENVSVQIDEARCDDGAGHFEYTPRLFAGNRRCEMRDRAALDRHVESAIQALTPVDYRAALKN
jgi:hypothetical protein